MERFWSKVKMGKPDECWEWQAGSLSGYGRFNLKGKTRFAHRVSYILTHGEVPKWLFVCHKCNNRKCVNPNHLYTGTHYDNMQDRKRLGYNRHVTECPKGHSYSGDNLLITKRGRECRDCRKADNNKAIQKQKAHRIVNKLLKAKGLPLMKYRDFSKIYKVE